jgi:hypothetical protein
MSLQNHMHNNYLTVSLHTQYFTMHFVSSYVIFAFSSKNWGLEYSAICKYHENLFSIFDIPVLSMHVLSIQLILTASMQKLVFHILN